MPHRKNESPELWDTTFCHPNIVGNIGGFSVGENLGSQHSTISISVPFTNNPPKIYSNKPNFKKGNWDNFRNTLDDLLPNPDQVNVVKIEDIETLKNQIETAIVKADNKHIPRVKFKSLSKKLPPKIQNLLKIKRKLVKDFSKTEVEILSHFFL